MSPLARVVSEKPKTKRCPACRSECALGESTCPSCGHEFPVAGQRNRACADCGALNSVTAQSCHSCGASLQPSFSLTLDEALRVGAIIRGMDIDEEEVQLAEEIAPEIRNRVLRSGDEKLVKILRVLPDESWARLRQILSSS